MGLIFVTGSRGRLGSALYGLLVCRGEEVIGTSRVDLDLADGQHVIGTLESIRPKLIFHTAALTDVDACERDPKRAWRDNLEATRNLAEAASRIKARLIHFSTDYVFDGTKNSPYTEDDQPNPINVYGRTKYMAETGVQEMVENHVIIRVSWLFGVKNDFVSMVLAKIKEGTPLMLVDDHRGSPGYIPDLLPGILDIAFSDEKGILHLTNSGDCNRLEMGSEIIRILDLDAEPVAASGEMIGFVAQRPAQTVLSCARYEERFGKTLRSWQEALRAYLTHTG